MAFIENPNNKENGVDKKMTFARAKIEEQGKRLSYMNSDLNEEFQFVIQRI